MEIKFENFLTKEAVIKQFGYNPNILDSNNILILIKNKSDKSIFILADSSFLIKPGFFKFFSKERKEWIGAFIDWGATADKVEIKPHSQKRFVYPFSFNKYTIDSAVFDFNYLTSKGSTFYVKVGYKIIDGKFIPIDYGKVTN
ncbi:MAG: hypothetical protein NTX03_10255 [Bacteroidetes bacterium]|nr:hypothetical protein [Bacteroidota bacterium]